MARSGPLGARPWPAPFARRHLSPHLATASAITATLLVSVLAAAVAARPEVAAALFSGATVRQGGQQELRTVPEVTRGSRELLQVIQTPPASSIITGGGGGGGEMSSSAVPAVMKPVADFVSGVLNFTAGLMGGIRGGDDAADSNATNNAEGPPSLTPPTLPVAGATAPAGNATAPPNVTATAGPADAAPDADSASDVPPSGGGSRPPDAASDDDRYTPGGLEGGARTGNDSGGQDSAEGLACDWRRAHEDCAPGFSCIPTDQVLPASCVANPTGGNPLLPDLAGPVVFYPLTNGSLAPWPPGSRSAYNGSVIQGTPYWTDPDAENEDELFPGALTCDLASDSLVSLPGLPYGRTGAFTINFWMRKREQDNPSEDEEQGGQVGGEFEYMLSHANLQPLGSQAKRYSAFDKNQINVYLPSRRSSLYGIVRGIVKDSNDSPDPLFLDSDGAVGDPNRDTPRPSDFNLTDGEWHMVTLSSQPEGGRGWRMYVDGKLATQIPEAAGMGASDLSSTFTASNLGVDGGDALYMGGPLLLCGRYGGIAARAYGGQLANLAIYDAVLSARQVELLYNMVMDPESVPRPSLPLRSHPWYGTTLLTPPQWLEPDDSDAALTKELTGRLGPTVQRPQTPGAGNATELGDGGAAALAAVLTAALTGVSYNQGAGAPCSLDLRRETGLAFCSPRLVCAPVPYTASTLPGADNISTTSSASSDAYEVAGDALASIDSILGVCTPPASGMLLPTGWPADWPAPAAHFPLTGGSFVSWPTSEYGGNFFNATWVPDTRFGEVIRCDKARGSAIVLEPVPYGRRGRFAVNLWVRTSKDDLAGRIEAGNLTSSDGFQYIFSTRGPGAGLFGPNQIHLYIPEAGSPLYGMSVRAILQDGNDESVGRPSEVFVDSDGAVGNNSPRNGGPRDDGLDIADGGWHMITLSTQLWGPGYALYVDGVLRGQLTAQSKRSTTNTSDTNILIPGGDPAQLEGPLVLCGRAGEDDPKRHFSGSVAALSLWDASLTPWQVAALYAAYQEQAVAMPAGLVLKDGGYISASTTDGKPCVFPLSYAGRAVYSCIILSGVLSCPVQGRNWSSCAIPQLADSNQTDGNATTGSTGAATAPGAGTAPNLLGLTGVTYDNSTGGDDSNSTNEGNIAAITELSPAELLDLSDYGIADGTMLGPAGGSMPRLTTGGQLCVLPFNLGNTTYTDCATIQGVEMCPTIVKAVDLVKDGSGPVSTTSLPLMECAPMVSRPPANSSCRSAAAVEALIGPDNSGGRTLKNFSQCVSLMGVDACQTQAGVWLLCPPPPRITLSGQPCQLPFQLGAMMRSDCTLYTPLVPPAAAPGTGDNSSSDLAAVSLVGREVCAVDDGSLQECSPPYVLPHTLQPRSSIRFTIDRQLCRPPGPSALSECLDYSVWAAAAGAGGPGALGGGPGADLLDLVGKYSCQIESGALLECAPVERMSVGTSGAAKAMNTTRGCTFPFSYGGRNRTDCVWLNGVEACKLHDGSWAECSTMSLVRFPAPPPNITLIQRHTVRGQPCALPFYYNGSLRWDCVNGGLDPGFCRSRSGSWEQCMPRAQGGTPRSTITGQLCQLPFFPPMDDPAASPLPTNATAAAGPPPKPAFDCVGPPPGHCLNPQGRMEPCAPRPRIAANGVACSLPFTFRNTTYYDCFTPPADIAAAALAAAANAAPAAPGVATPATSGAAFAPGPGSASALEFCSPSPVALSPKELSPCVPLDSELLGANNYSSISQVPPGAAGIVTGVAPTDQDLPMAEMGADTGAGGRDAAVARRRRDLGLGLGLGVGLPGLMLLVAGLAALRRRWARRHMRRVIREMRMDSAGTPHGSMPGFPAPSALAPAGADVAELAGSSATLMGYAGPMIKTASPTHDAASEVEMSPGAAPGKPHVMFPLLPTSSGSSLSNPAQPLPRRSFSGNPPANAAPLGTSLLMSTGSVGSSGEGGSSTGRPPRPAPPPPFPREGGANAFATGPPLTPTSSVLSPLNSLERGGERSGLR